MRWLPILLLSFTGLTFLVFGAWYAFDVRAPLAMLGIHIDGEIASTHLRTYLGGLQIGLGLYLLGAAAYPPFRRGALWLVFLCHGCMGLTRMLGVILGGPYAPVFFALLVWELGLAFLALLALALTREAARRGARRASSAARESATLGGHSPPRRHEPHRHPQPSSRSPL